MDASNDTTIPVQINIAANALPPSSAAVPAVGASVWHSSKVNVDGSRNSDTEKHVSPWKALETAPFVARLIQVHWDINRARETGYELLSGNASDKRSVFVTEGELWQEITKADPLVLPLTHNDKPRQLYPRYEICVEKIGLSFHVGTWRVLAMLPDEIDKQERRVKLDRLQAVGHELGIARAVRETIMRKYQQETNWWPLAEQGMREYAASKNAPVVEEKPVSDVETWFGPKTAKRAPWGAEGEAIKAERKPFSVFGHFRRELLKQNPDADPAAVALIVLGMTIEESCEKIGVSKTIDKLQTYLDKPEDITVTAPAAIKITKEQWAAWLDFNELDATNVLAALHKFSMTRGDGPITKLSEWDGTLVEAYEVVVSDAAQYNAETHAVDAASVPAATVAATEVPATPNGATAGKVEPQTGHATAYPNWPESPVTCWPDPGGSVIHKGIRFNVSFRVGGCWELLIPLMDGFAAHRECIDPSCLVRPMQTAATGGSTAPRDEDAPPDDGDNSEPQYQSGGGEEHENGTAIMRSVEGSKTTYTIYYNVGNGAETKYPKKISNPQGLKLLEAALRAAGRNPDKWENGRRYNSVKVNVWWKQGKEIAGQPGKHYNDYTRFEVVKEVEEVPA